jgi:thioesterase domain-containing protein
MWDHESIDAIAFALGDPRAVSPPAGVIYLQPRGRLTPLFCFPGALGHSVTFAPLATHLGADQPCYGLTVPGLDGEHQPLGSIEEIAAVMLGKIRLLQPTGPYQFAGYSFGGLLGFEVAQQLRRQGETVSVLALYDTFTPQGYVERPRWQRLALHAYILMTRAGRLDYVQQKLQRRQELRDARRTLSSTHTTAVEAREKIILEMEQTNIRAAYKYRPQPYGGRLLLFRATQRGSEDIFFKVEARTNGWGALAGECVRVVDIPGTHQSILRPENGPQAAELLRPHLAHASPGLRAVTESAESSAHPVAARR